MAGTKDTRKGVFFVAQTEEHLFRKLRNIFIAHLPLKITTEFKIL